jgi:hypothetical protein
VADGLVDDVEVVEGDALSDAVLVEDGVALADAVLVDDGEELADEVLVVDGEPLFVMTLAVCETDGDPLPDCGPECVPDVDGERDVDGEPVGVKDCVTVSVVVGVVVGERVSTGESVGEKELVKVDTPEIDAEASPFGPTLVTRRFMTGPATFEKPDYTYPQDWRLEAYYEVKPGVVVHAAAMWREADFGAIQSSDEGVQRLVLNGMQDWDETSSAHCAEM